MIKNFIVWVMSIFCKHSKDKFVRNIYGDEIIFGTPDFHRSIWQCNKCKSYFFDRELKQNHERSI